MSAVPFDKRLAELDAYLQMLISENESLDKKLTNYTRASNATINNYESEIEGILNIKNSLEKLLGSIKHSIVLLQIAKVSSRASFSSNAGYVKPNQQQPQSATPSPPARSKFRSFKSTSSSASKDTNHQKAASHANNSLQSLSESLSSSSSAASGARLSGNKLPQETGGRQGQRQRQRHSLAEPPSNDHQAPSKQSHRVDTKSAPKGSLAGTAAVSRSLEHDAITTNGGRGGKGCTPANIDNDGINSNGPQRAEETTLSLSPGTHNSDSVTTVDDGEDDDDDDAFFDAAEVQHNQSRNISNVDSPRGLSHSSSSSIQATHPDSLSVNSEKSSKNNQSSRVMPPAEGAATISSTSSSGDMPEANNNIDGQAEGQGIEWDALYEEEDEDELGSLEGQGSVIKHLLSQIRIGMDLTKVVLPTFILERRSLLEMYADFFAHPDLFSAIPGCGTPEERMIQLVRWYMSAFHAGRKSSLAKKPYNPILGEIFKCEWRLEEDTEARKDTRLGTIDIAKKPNDKTITQQQLTFVAEQVSHHPPVSAFYAENKEKSISCCAHIYTKSKYLGLSVGVHNIGKGVINLTEHNETYVCTFPSAYGRSILTVPWVELGGPVTIACEKTGYKANIDFVMKPFYGGKKHRITGEILRPNNEPILTIDGEWNGTMYSKSPPSSSGKQVFVDTTSLPVIKKRVKPVTLQESFESRNVWKEVTRALKLKDVNSATAAKSYIEQRQRDQLKDRLEKGIKWRTRYFQPADDGWQYAGEASCEDGEQAGDGDLCANQ